MMYQKKSEYWTQFVTDDAIKEELKKGKSVWTIAKELHTGLIRVRELRGSHEP